MLSKSEKEFLKVYNDLKKYPSLTGVAIRLGLSKKTVQNKIGIIRAKLAKSNPDDIEVISRAVGKVPMSEDQSRFIEDWTAQDCIDELVRIAKIDEDMVITRNYFRVHSKISESTWNRYFGTFNEFKRQAGITLTRQQHAQEKAVAKHASVDHYRRMNIDRADYAHKYDRNKDTKFKTILFCSDLHDKEIDPFYLRVLIDTAKRVQPDIICLVGDVFDLPEFGRYTVDPREWDTVGRIKFVHNQILGPLRLACPDAQIDMIEGNHEARLLRMLADSTPALRAVLSDLHGMTVGSLLGLDRFEINYVAKSDLAIFTKREHDKELAKNYRVYYDAALAHHFPHAKSMGLPGVNGHHHQHQVWSMFNPIYGAYEWHQLAAGHRRSASYCEGEKWHNGFAILNLNAQTKSTNFDYVPVTDFAVSGGKWYVREDDEQLPESRLKLHVQNEEKV